jgi:hypothetical protein
MPLEFDDLARVYNRTVNDGESVEDSFNSVSKHHDLPGTLEEYKVAIKEVQSRVEGGGRWPASVHAVSLNPPNLGVVTAKKAKKSAKKVAKKPAKKAGKKARKT